jgi:4-diphosphocytidyl-2-C-methyl-D-erythritol kinase
VTGAIPLRVAAHAKVNLSLRVLAREESGFHQIETLFCALELADEVELLRDDAAGDAIELDVLAPPEDRAATAPDLGDVELNLAYRAAVAFREQARVAGGLRIRLTKRIPAGAGLGGGSSDAAAVLRGLNELYGGPLTEIALLEAGARLGSDVPFLLSGAALAFGWGRGGRLLPLPPLPSAAVLLAVPREGVPTGDAYGALAHVREEAASDSGVAPGILHVPRSWDEVEAENDFEDVVFNRLPEMRDVRERMAEAGAVVARLTGTGSVVFGVFSADAAAQRVADRLAAAFPDLRLIATRSLETLARTDPTQEPSI